MSWIQNIREHNLSQPTRWWAGAYLAFAVSMGLVACGGGGGDASPTNVAASTEATNASEVAGVVAAAEDAKIMLALEDETATTTPLKSC
jgi:hypothetical protein